MSHNFFRKEWPQRELDGLTARDDGKSTVLLPVWYNVSAEEVRRFSPPLADKLSTLYSGSVKGVVSKLLRAIQREQIRETGWTPEPVKLNRGIESILLPVRPVDGKALCMGQYPITNQLYQTFCKSTKHRDPMGEHFVSGSWMGPFSPWTSSDFSDPSQPVVCVDFWDSIKFCEWASSKQSQLFLPSAELWDYAATSGRLGATVRNVIANIDKAALHHKCEAPAKIASDGSRDNVLCLSDHFGNVWEWCGGNRYEQAYEAIALLARRGDRRMEAELRGGGFLDDLRVIHPELRSGMLEDGTNTRHTDLGFRVGAVVDLKKIPVGLSPY